ncbi:hypothetical protein HZC35_05645 [Candidatus Saganbacteria bacterium]|nr:hypothetical protein [Candidatus Saganbacteria bacterium]
MWYLLFSGLLGMVFGMLVLFFPTFLEMLNKVIDRELKYSFEQDHIPRLINGLVLLLASLFLILTGNWYPELWALFYTGVLAMVFGILFIFFPRFLGFLNDLGNLVVIAPEEAGTFQRIVSGIILLLMSTYILFTYFGNGR